MMVFLSPSRKMPEHYLNLGPKALSSTLFPLTTQYHPVIPRNVSESLRVSPEKLHIKIFPKMRF
jgi:hypothetical protein